MKYFHFDSYALLTFLFVESCLVTAQLESTLTNMKISQLKQLEMIAQSTLRQYVRLLD